MLKITMQKKDPAVQKRREAIAKKPTEEEREWCFLLSAILEFHELFRDVSKRDEPLYREGLTLVKELRAEGKSENEITEAVGREIGPKWRKIRDDKKAEEAKEKERDRIWTEILCAILEKDKTAKDVPEIDRPLVLRGIALYEKLEAEDKSQEDAMRIVSRDIGFEFGKKPEDRNVSTDFSSDGGSYDVERIKSMVTISAALNALGIAVNNGRAVAVWRGGERDSVAIDDDKGTWCDHGNKDEGGDVFALVQKIRVCNFPDACKWLDETFFVNAKKKKKSKVTATYDYTEENGVVLYRVLRYEPGFNGEKKTFVQMKVDASGKVIKGKGCMKDVRRVPYHLPRLIEGVKKNVRIFIVEGEKDVENVEKLGLYATCNVMGAANDHTWHDEYSDFFKGAAIVTIIADRDGAEKDFPGQRHAEQVRESLERAGVKASVVYVGDASSKDASDWIARGATADDFNALADNPPPWVPPWQSQEATATADAGDGEEATQGEERKKSKEQFKKEERAIFDKHKSPKVLSNYTEEWAKNEKGKNVVYYFARNLADIREEFDRMTVCSDGIGWPRKIGSSVFVFNRTKATPDQRYAILRDGTALFAWLRTFAQPKWQSANGGAQDSDGVNFTTKAELFENIRQNALTYQGISRAPHYPLRQDQFYDYGELPQPSEGHRVFWGLLDRMCPANEVYRKLMAAFFCAPMYFRVTASSVPGEVAKPLPRPEWLIGTIDAQGSGKSTVAKVCAAIYGSEVIDTSIRSIQQDPDRFKKRLLSAEGRQRRVCLIDNATGTIADDNLSSWITSSSISGMAPYGRGEETRPNDLTWSVSTNGAKIDDDTADRSYTIKVMKRTDEYVATFRNDDGEPLGWEEDVYRYIAENRLQIYADIIDMLKTAKPRKSDSRFPDFDRTVLSGVCETDEEFFACRESIKADARGANVSTELAEELTEAVENYLANVAKYDSDFDPQQMTMISHNILKKLIQQSQGELAKKTAAEIHAMLRTGAAPKFSPRFSRLAASQGNPRPESILYGMHLVEEGAKCVKYQLLDLVLLNGTPVPRVVRPGELSVRAL